MMITMISQGLKNETKEHAKKVKERQVNKFGKISVRNFHISSHGS